MEARQNNDGSDEEEGGDAGLVTPEEVDTQYNLLESVMSAFGVEDEFLGALLANQVQMARVEQRENELLQEIVSRQDPQLVGEFPFDMSHNVPAGTPETDPKVTERVPDEQGEANLVGISVGWPDGANNAVGIQISTGDGLKLLPRNPQDKYLAFNDFTETFGLRYTLRPGETLIARTVNLDSSNDHFVNIVPQIEEVVGEDRPSLGDGGEN